MFVLVQKYASSMALMVGKDLRVRQSMVTKPILSSLGGIIAVMTFLSNSWELGHVQDMTRSRHSRGNKLDAFEEKRA